MKLKQSFKQYWVLVLVAFATLLSVLFGLFRWQDSRLTTAIANERLEQMQQVQGLVAEIGRQGLESRGQQIVGNQGVTGYVAQALGGSLPGVVFDTASLVDLLQDRRDQMDLAVAAVIDAQGQVVASTEPFAAGSDFSRNPLYLDASKTGKVHTGLMVDGGRLLRVSIQPLVDYGVGVAHLLVAERIGIEQAKAIADIGHADVALLADTKDGLLMVASTLPADQQVGLQDRLPERGKVGVKRIEISLGGTRQDVSVEPLFGVTQARLVSLVRPRTDNDSFLALRLPFLIGCGLLLLALAALSWWIWKQWITPANALVDVVERAAQTNDMHMSAPVGGSEALRRTGEAINQIFKQRQSR
ncbi:MAG: hypothetical protein ABIO61_04250 [Thermomonas sp.]